MKFRTLLLLSPVVLVVLGWAVGVCNGADAVVLMQSDEPPVIPVGLDAYRMWDKLGCQRIGLRAYMRSTYDREGNNRTADASHFLYQESDGFNVTLDVKSPGVLYFTRTNHWHGSPWHYEVDGEDFLVQETATADPVNAKWQTSCPSYPLIDHLKDGARSLTFHALIQRGDKSSSIWQHLRLGPATAKLLYPRTSHLPPSEESGREMAVVSMRQPFRSRRGLQ